MKLIKIVYGYDIDKDRIAARHYYDDDTSSVQYHTQIEWQELLYGIRTSNAPVEIKTAVEELVNEAR